MPELTRRYVVMAMAAEAPFDLRDPDGVFVLKPWKDPAALRALMTYRDNCYAELGRELDGWISAIATGPAIRGDVGRRNEAHLAALDAAGRSRGAGAGGARRRKTAERGRRGGASRKAGAARSKRTATHRRRRR
jgi:hypothetical protein